MGKNYEQHKKYHNDFVTLRDMLDDNHINGLKVELHQYVNNFFQQHAKDGVLRLTDLSDNEVKSFTDGMHDVAGKYLLKSYYKLNEDQISQLESIESIDGGSLLEQMVTSALGGIDKIRLFDVMKNKGEMRMENMYQEFTALIPSQHQSFRMQDYVSKHLNQLEHKEGLESYLTMAKEHNPRALKNLRTTDFKSVSEAHQGLMAMAQYLQNVDYNPDMPTGLPEPEPMPAHMTRQRAANDRYSYDRAA